MLSDLSLQKKAWEFRNKNGIGINDPLDFPGILSKLNILTVFKPLKSEISGMAGDIRSLKFMLINSNHTIGRQNFTIAHELFHLFYDDTFTDSIIDFETGKNSTEKSADLFASFLLLPEGLIEIIPEAELSKNKITIPSIVKIEQYYRCSRQALLIRLKGLNLIDKKYMEKLGIDVINQVKILGYDTSLYQSGNNNRVIGSYALYAKKLYDNDIISESNFIDLLLDSGIDPVGLDLNVSIG
ncbi:MAG: ImmA/IrrE family metallo-endopeptidase [Spirochaetia bacterium]|jgi:Zn-dependent peptidase ImmA (M78 family)|nr:ImmA/IrrE family metallo-endopeptidase [Spirochaetia bacterium]